MQERKPPATLAQLLSRHEGMGGVIETVFLNLEGRDGQANETHREAAISTLQVLRDRTDQYFSICCNLSRTKTAEEKNFSASGLSQTS
ncbi:MAG: hypothetical protein F6K28_38520 [Microcoleus sp. SIO2G3]|nr:hypothetical protein [Microcoleus sp. SIO2G3]